MLEYYIALIWIKCRIFPEIRGPGHDFIVRGLLYTVLHESAIGESAKILRAPVWEFFMNCKLMKG